MYELHSRTLTSETNQLFLFISWSESYSFALLTSSYSHLQRCPWTTGELPSPVHSKHAKTTKLHVHNFHQETPRSTKRKQNILDHNSLIQIVITFLTYMYVKIMPLIFKTSVIQVGLLFGLRPSLQWRCQFEYQAHPNYCRDFKWPMKVKIPPPGNESTFGQWWAV